MVVNLRPFTAILYGLLYFMITCRSNTEKFNSNMAIGDTPLVQIADVTNVADITKPFSLKKDAQIRVYAVGEMDIALATMAREYYFKSDDIELFFGNKTHFNPGRRHRNAALIYSWLDGEAVDNEIHFIKDSVEYTSQYDTKNRCYKILIKIPSQKLTGQSFRVNDSFPFDIAIGDNDDGMKQKAKIAWYNTDDPLQRNPIDLGKLFLSDTLILPQKKAPGIYSIKKESEADISSFDWNDIKPTKITNIVAGEVKDSTDLNAELKSCWDEQYLYFNILVFDSRKGFAIPETVMTSKTFHDYGWIEDEKGKTVWQMHALYSKHAGGARKNQVLDTCIKLKKGNYFLKYVTDESHNWNNWDDKPPRVNFYGIALYQKIN